MAWKPQMGILLIVSLLLAPGAFASTDANEPEAVVTPLYFHAAESDGWFVFDSRPDPDNVLDSVASAPIVAGPGSRDDVRGGHNSFFGTFMTVAVPPEEEGNYNREDPHYSPGAVILLDGNTTPVVHLYVRLESATGPSVPVVAPNYVFRATMETGSLDWNEYWSSPDAIADPTTVMEGEVSAHLVDGRNGDLDVILREMPADRPIMTPDDEGIIHILIPLISHQDKIGRDEALGLRVEWFQAEDEEVSVEAADGSVHLTADAAHMPRLELGITNLLSTSYLHPQPVPDGALVHFGVLAPLGKGDVDPHRLRLQIEGPDTYRFAPLVYPKIASGGYVNGLYIAEMSATFFWEHSDQPLADGVYDLTASAGNRAGTAQVVATGQLVVQNGVMHGIDENGDLIEPYTEEAPQTTPAIGLLPILLVLLAGSLPRRRS